MKKVTVRIAVLATSVFRQTFQPSRDLVAAASLFLGLPGHA
ncbi:MAG: hypothetical protein SGJ13_17775 [Actinomycetota bacterium]|nr:hypothetical protein [Actinomycetota bacterium]